jgi:hypothetical protein
MEADMFDWLLGNSSIEPVPAKIREKVEKELFNFCYSLYLAWSLGMLLMEQDRRDSQKTLFVMDTHITIARDAITNVQKLWPTGNSVLEDLRNTSNFLPDWLLNLRSWHSYVADITEDKIPEIDRGKYQRFVIKNREFSNKVENNFSKAIKKFSKAGINLESIKAKSGDSLSKSEIEEILK